MQTPEQRPTLTISESGTVLTETHDGIELPADYSFATINDFVHAHGRHFEELQYLALGMACKIDTQQALIAELEQRLAAETARADAAEQDAARYRYIRTRERLRFDDDNGEFSLVSTFSSAEDFDAAIDATMQTNP